MTNLTNNTRIATSKKNTLIEFTGTDTSKSGFMIISHVPKYIIINGLEILRNNISVTYNTKVAGLMTEGMELGLRVRKAVNQRYDNDKICKYSEIYAESITDAYNKITNSIYGGGLASLAIQ